MNIHTNLSDTKISALIKADVDKIDYVIIIKNPNENNEFDMAAGSTYDIITEEHYRNSNKKYVKICTTKELKNERK